MFRNIICHPSAAEATDQKEAVVRTPRLACLLVMAALFAVPSAGAQPSDDLKALRQDIEAIRKELPETAEIRELLTFIEASDRGITR